MNVLDVICSDSNKPTKWLKISHNYKLKNLNDMRANVKNLNAKNHAKTSKKQAIFELVATGVFATLIIIIVANLI